MKSGVTLICDFLKSHNLTQIFGYPGGVLLSLYDALYSDKELKHVLVRHEQAAVHMAEGFFKSSGRMAVVLVTSGPGASNTVTGIINAMMDSVPILIISGQVHSRMIGHDAFQEADIIGITRPITKWNRLVRHINDLEESLLMAIDVAMSGRPGPVLLDIAKDVFNAQTAHRPTFKAMITDKKSFSESPSWRIMKELQQAKRPLFMIGGGLCLSDSELPFKKLLKTTNIPVIATLNGLNAGNFAYPFYLGMVGMHGHYQANKILDSCDCLIALGARFDDRVLGNVSEFAKNAVKIQIDIDLANKNKDLAVDYFFDLDLKILINELLEIGFSHQISSDYLIEIQDALKQQHRQVKSDLHPIAIIRCINKVFNGQVCVVSDVGQHQMWVAQELIVSQSKSLINSGGLGTMGFSVPAAIGAAFAGRNPVISVSGDGGFQMNMQELIVAAYHHLPILFIVFNNQRLGMVKQWQDFFYEQRESFTDLSGQNPDFCKIAEANSLPARKVQWAFELESSLRWAASKLAEGPVLLEFQIDENAHVYPMIPIAGSFKNIIKEEEAF